MDKLKTIAGHVLCYSISLACDAALIHNFFYQDRWNVYCDRYIMAFECFSWVILFATLVSLVNHAIAASRPDFLKRYKDTVRKSSTGATSIWRKVYFFVNSLPMLLFVWVFVGDISLGIVWGLCALFGIWNWDMAKRAKEALEKLDAEPDLNINPVASRNVNLN